MNNTDKEEQDKTKTCELPETRSISEKVHKHLRDKNDHITDEDIRNADIDPNANELDDLHREDPQKNKEEMNREDSNKGKDQITPWDVIDKNATE